MANIRARPFPSLVLQSNPAQQLYLYFIQNSARCCRPDAKNFIRLKKNVSSGYYAYFAYSAKPLPLYTATKQVCVPPQCFAFKKTLTMLSLNTTYKKVYYTAPQKEGHSFSTTKKNAYPPYSPIKRVRILCLPHHQ